MSRDYENLPLGRVTELRHNWLVQEDQSLAHRLQNEEYQHHLGHNRERNAILRQDTPHARAEQIREDEEAASVRSTFEELLAKQEEYDTELAGKLAEQLEIKEEEEKRLMEERDALYAKDLIENEKKTIRQTRELRQVDREAAYLGINAALDNVPLLSRQEAESLELSRQDGSLELPRQDASREDIAEESFDRSPRSQISLDLSDLSDFQIKPSRDMDEEEQRILQENQDAELAGLLQSVDKKRRGDLLQQDQLLAIEAQDRELAKVLQEQERAKAKKARQKAKQKALAKKQARLAQQQQDLLASRSADNGSHSSDSSLEQPVNSRLANDQSESFRDVDIQQRTEAPTEQQVFSRSSLDLTSPEMLPTYFPPEDYLDMDRDVPRYGNKSTLISAHGSQSKGLNISVQSNFAHTPEKRRSDESRRTFDNVEFRPGNRIPVDILRPMSSRPPPRPDFLDIPGLSHPSRLQENYQQTRPSYFKGEKTVNSQMEEPEETYTMISPITQNPAAFTNIACAIDPTYQRRVQRGEIAQMNSPISPQVNSSQIASARQLTSANLENHTLLSSSSSSSNNSHNMGPYMVASGTNASSPISPLPPPVFDDDDDYPVPPYMPIQGQRRTASLEKNLRSKQLFEKPSGKDGCKQQ